MWWGRSREFLKCVPVNLSHPFFPHMRITFWGFRSRSLLSVTYSLLESRAGRKGHTYLSGGKEVVMLVPGGKLSRQGNEQVQSPEVRPCVWASRVARSPLQDGGNTDVGRGRGCGALKAMAEGVDFIGRQRNPLREFVCSLQSKAWTFPLTLSTHR